MTLMYAWLGRPDSTFGMLALPAVPIGPSIGGSHGMSPSMSRATVGQTKMSGGMTAAHRPDLKSTYGFQWKMLNPTKTDLLMSFYDGRQSGPYCFVDPSQYNFLPVNVASAGLAGGALNTQGRTEWTAGTGAVAVSSQAGPTGLITGVMGWTGAGNASVLWMGPNNGIDATWMPPVLQGKAHRFAVYAKMLSGSASLTAAAISGNAGGTTTAATATAPTVVLSGSWQEVSATVATSFSWAGNDYCTMKLTVSSSSSPSILLAAASMVYDDVTAAALSPWVAGVGVPRLIVPKGVDSPVGRPGLRDFTMTMAEI